MVKGQETESGSPVDLFPSNHPLTPPQSTEDRVSWLRLLRSRRVGVTTFFRLMNEHGSAADALDVLPEIAQAAGEQDYQICPLPVVEQELDWAAKTGAVMLTYGSSDYPARLADIPDPPPILWALGDTSLLTRFPTAIVGARNASSLGLRMSRRLSGELGREGQVIVSGLARGIDTAAHQAALETGTIAVFAGGVDVVYPSENTVLGEEIARAGLRLSEAPMGLSPQARHFPRRNRIISGLSRAVVVVEAAAKSGSLMTAEMALEQGREVFAVPGHPFDARSAGCNRLIRDGATLLRGPQDVLSVLAEMPDAHAPQPDMSENVAETEQLPAPPVETRTLAETLQLHQMILDRLDTAPLPEDQLIRDLSQPASDVTSELTQMEMEGAILRGPGGVLSRKH
ncbi:DNA-processing protein DprA [Maritimibacter sp. DP4N28-5]|uniref:DNA-processing protein DprA n=1 Tax=Maritimibacter dapengensis TaxID=2836868 RepID=A0ABS6T0I2_9RHOB|nr:DNA-processing protein DprA [Maritimibacter dapengensis]MBV7378742.1 DNA-processing protein DprA [Maritimibacter dapengensis]